jgi:hypothetical protein
VPSTRSAGRDARSADLAAAERDFHFDRRPAARIEYLARPHLFDHGGGHKEIIIDCSAMQ